MKKIMIFSIAAILSLGTLIAEARPKVIGMKRATEIARSHAPGLTLKAKELEKEKGRWIYSFEFKNRDGSIREVNINATTGKLVGIEREDAKKEAKEKN